MNVNSIIGALPQEDLDLLPDDELEELIVCMLETDAKTQTVDEKWDDLSVGQRQIAPKLFMIMKPIQYWSEDDFEWVSKCVEDSGI